MAILGVSKQLGDRRIGELRANDLASAGSFWQLGSSTGFARLASQTAQFVLEYDVTTTGVAEIDFYRGIEIQATQQMGYARLLQLVPGDLVYTDQLASGAETGAITGALIPNQLLGIDPATGKLRQKQTVDVEFARISPEGGNTFNTNGCIWAEIVRLA